MGVAFALVLAAGLQQPTPAPRVFDNVKLGDHVEVVLKNNFSFRGICFPVTPDKKQLTIKLYGYPEVDGTITFKEHNVKRVIQLKALSDADRERMLEEVRQAQERTAAAEEARRRREAEALAKRKEAEAKAAEEEERAKETAKKQEKAVSFYKRFPPKDGWGPEKFDEIKGKVNGTPEEQLFFNNFELWLEGKQYAGDE
jgi:molecular chaperone DnaK (HSP70)